MLMLFVACSQPEPPAGLPASAESAAACYQGHKLIYESKNKWTEASEFPTTSGGSTFFQDGAQRVMITGSAACVFRFDPVEILNKKGFK